RAPTRPARAAALLILALIPACRGDATARMLAASRTATAQGLRKSLTAGGIAASRVSFDAAIEASRSPAKGKHANAIHVHVDRTRADTGWSTTITLLNDHNAPRPRRPDHRISQFIVDGAGNASVVLGDGSTATLAEATRLPDGVSDPK